MVGDWCRNRGARDGYIPVVVIRVNDGGTGDLHATVDTICRCPACEEIRRRLERNPR